jgi:2-dehydro-3-deoxygalactonokinase
MKRFISGDWGTTNLRLRLVDSENQHILSEITSSQGIATTFGEWQQRASDHRLSFYQSILLRQIHHLQEQTHFPLEGLPLVLSGMASSSLGMLELPYQPVPFSATGEELCRRDIPASADFHHHILLVSGVRTDDDVMRGEETQLIGCLSEGDKGERLFIFPGTHSKHVRVRDGQALSFSTFMTGEFFHLLSAKSILAGSVAPPPSQASFPSQASLPPSFEKGVEDSRHSSLLHHAFLVRTNQLLGHLSKEDNYYYLSGLLIGEELRHLSAAHPSPSIPPIPLTIVSTGRLQEYYLVACHHLGLTDIDIVDADQALIKGHCILLDLPAGSMP